MSATFELVAGYILKTNYVDSDTNTTIINKSMSSIIGTTLSGEKNSQYIQFYMDRYYDGIDLSEKLINVCYMITSTGEGGSDSPINVYRNDTQIKFGWVIPYSITSAINDIQIGILCIGSEYGEEYIFKTKTNTYKIENGFICGQGIDEPDINWYEQFLIQIQNVVTEYIIDLAQTTSETKTYIDDVADEAVTYISDKVGEYDSLEARLDVLISDGTQTEGNTELLDIRAGQDGTTYDTAGNAVRGQVEQLTSYIEVIEDEILDARTDFTGTAQTNLNERINSDVAMLLDRFNAATSVPYEGEFINASNTYLGTMRETKINGKTYQNLARLDLPASELFETFNGTEENEQITLVGKSAMQYAFYKYNLQLFKPSTDYTVVLNVMANSSNKQFFATSATDTASAYQPVFATQIAVNAGESGIFKFLATTKSDISNCSCVLKSYLPSTVTGSITYSFMILEGDYTNIDLPSAITGIESVSGELVETSCGKNLFNTDTVAISSGGITSLETVNGGLKFDFNGTYQYVGIDVSWINEMLDKTFILNYTNFQSTNENAISRIQFGGKKNDGTAYYQNVTTLGSPFTLQDASGSKPSIITSLNFFGNNGATFLSGTFSVENVQIEIGETATDYEPYIADTQTFEDITLHSLPDGTCDYIDKQNDCWVQNVGKVVITGTETVVVNSHTTGQKYCSLDNIAATIANASILCNLYQASTWTMENGKVYIPNGNSIVINDNNFTDVATAKAIFTEKFNSGEPVTVYYPLATPIVHQLPCRELKSYDGTTNISIAGSNISPTTATKIPSDTATIISNMMSN